MKIIKVSSVLLGLMSVSLNAFATMPVIDYTEVAKTAEVIGQLDKQYTEMKKQYDTMQNQYNQLKQQYQSITGNYGWGDWQNSVDNLTHDREWTASDWQSALKGMSGGNPDRYQQLLDQYKQNHTTMATQDYAKGTDSALATNYQNEVQTNQASATTATYEFNDINTHLQTVQQLGQEIENAKKNNDLKSAMDLNSRVQVEVAYISIEELRMQAVINQQLAQMQANTIAMQSEASQYNQTGVDQ